MTKKTRQAPGANVGQWSRFILIQVSISTSKQAHPPSWEFVIFFGQAVHTKTPWFGVKKCANVALT